MRRMRAIGAAMVICLMLGAPVPMLAQEAVGTAVMVTGTQDCDFGSGVCTFTASDPRVAGTGRIVSSSDAVTTDDGTPAFMWDEVTLEGPEGTWSGHHYALADETFVAHVFMVLSGAGAYEGWQYVATGTDTPPHGSHDLTGVLFEGPVPPVGPVVTVATES